MQTSSNNTNSWMRRIVTCSASIVLFVPVLNAQATRTWISGVGDDANPCSRTAPCKTFAGAISKTAPGGEIDALDPGGFGALTITKSITLDGGGGQVASILVAGTNGLVVAAASTDVVTIRNMRIQGLLGGGNSNAGLNGIDVISAGQVHIQNCYIDGFSQRGIAVIPGAGYAPQVSIDTTSVTNSLGAGLYVDGTANAGSGETHVSVTNSHFNSNKYGVYTTDNTRTSVFNSEASGNSKGGFFSLANTTPSILNVAHSLVADNTLEGIGAGGGGASATVRAGGNELFGNGTSFSTSANGTILSFGNNNNGGGGSPTSTISPQ